MSALLNWHRVRELLRKEFRQMFRDPRARRLLFVAPIVQLIIFGYAVNTDVRNARLMVLDRDNSAQSRALVDAMTSSGYFVVGAHAERTSELVRALDHGDALATLEIPRKFAADLSAGRPTSVQFLVDGTTANTANVLLGYAGRIISQWGAAHSSGRGPGSGGTASGRAPPGNVAGSASPTRPGVDFRARAWYNPGLVSRVYNVPAVIGTIVLMMTLLLTSLAVVRERELGTLEQLMVSPLKPLELVIGKTVPPVFVAFVDLILVTVISLLWFHIPFRGSALFLPAASLVFILSGLGVGLFISTISATQQEAFMSMFFFFLPAILLSGFLFPIANMPESLQYLTYLNPLRYFLEIVRGVFLRGAGWQILWPQVLVLFLIGVGVLGAATQRFRKTAR
jgi:ABC-2 type transport system permease protein